MIEIKKGMDKLLKKLNNTYFKREVLKYILPEEIKRNNSKAPIQNLINTIIRVFFVLGQEKNKDLDNSRYSFVGCCSFGTGHLDSLIS